MRFRSVMRPACSHAARSAETAGGEAAEAAAETPSEGEGEAEPEGEEDEADDMTRRLSVVSSQTVHSITHEPTRPTARLLLALGLSGKAARRLMARLIVSSPYHTAPPACSPPTPLSIGADTRHARGWCAAPDRHTSRRPGRAKVASSGPHRSLTAELEAGGAVCARTAARSRVSMSIGGSRCARELRQRRLVARSSWRTPTRCRAGRLAAAERLRWQTRQKRRRRMDSRTSLTCVPLMETATRAPLKQKKADWRCTNLAA